MSRSIRAALAFALAATALSLFGDPRLTSVSIATMPNPSFDGDPVTIVATVFDETHENHGRVTDGIVRFYRQTNTEWFSLGTVGPSGSTYSLTASLPLDTVAITAQFEPNGHPFQYCCDFCCLFGLCGTCTGHTYDYHPSISTESHTVLPKPCTISPHSIVAATTPDATSCDVTLPQSLVSVHASSNCVAGTLTRTPESNTFPVGETTITWQATDALSGNTVSATQTITVIDRTPPVVTRNGDAEMTIQCGSVWVDPGATTRENCPPATESTITNPDTSYPARWGLQYLAVDAAGNMGWDQRILNVVDTTGPVIVLNGDEDMTAECHTPFEDPGATASDACTGPQSVTVSGAVDANTLGAYELTYASTDPYENASSRVRTVRVVDATPPLITGCPAPRSIVACSAPVPDFTGDAAATDPCSGVASVAQSLAPGTLVGIGAHDVTIIVTDVAGNNATCTTIFTVVNHAPSVSANGPYEVVEGSSVVVTATGSDADGNPVTLDWDLNADNTFESNGASATYASIDGLQKTLVVARATDVCGVSSTDATTLRIDNAPPQVSAIAGISGAIPVGTEITVSAPFTDAGILDTHTALWEWDDGSTTPGALTETNGSGVTSASHVFTTAGVYRITVTVTETSKLSPSSGTASYEFVEVYDDGSTATGNGTIDSPVGAYAPLPNRSARGNFAFSARYSNGSPVGTAQFRLQGTPLIFRSTSYESLIIAGTRAQIRGAGTIAGETTPYTFILTAADEGGIGKFRIKIWNTDDGVVLYDNVSGASDDLDAASPQPIRTGRIDIQP